LKVVSSLKTPFPVTDSPFLKTAFSLITGWTLVPKFTVVAVAAPEVKLTLSLKEASLLKLTGTSLIIGVVEAIPSPLSPLK